MKNIVKILAKILKKIRSVYWSIIYSDYRTRYNLPPSFRFNGANILLYGDGDIVIGDNTYIGENSTVQAYKASSVTIGKSCKISHNVRIYTHTSDADSDFSISIIKSKVDSVKIDDFCWIGANVFINPGVVIGSNSVIGANSVVTKNIPDNEIWGGVPAKLIRRKKFVSSVES